MPRALVTPALRLRRHHGRRSDGGAGERGIHVVADGWVQRRLWRRRGPRQRRVAIAGSGNVLQSADVVAQVARERQPLRE